ncbi:HTH domain-containing protein, partial [Marinobacter sp.]|uniref:HTH domain-containing protein n=1 Tax=Marinobacter sp. TaxID=50741 RepID=UPI00199DE9C8
MKSKALITLLRDGNIHSGESLAQSLGVSRTAVWKQIRRAVDDGFEIATVRGKGYRLLTPVDLLDAGTISDGIAPEVRSRLQLTVLDEVDSTNAEVLRQWQAGV